MKIRFSDLYKTLSVVACAVFVTSCTDLTNTPGVTKTKFSYDDEVEDVNAGHDPLEPLNRVFFQTHYALDQVIIRPVSSVYGHVVPEEGKTAVSSFLSNLHEPVNFANSVLQGDVENSFASLWRFLLNSTFGMAGLYDFAGKQADLTARNADFGQTLAHYGVPSGVYLFIPLLGPTTVRDGAGWGVDILADPVTWSNDNAWSIAKWSAVGVDYRSTNMKVVDDLYFNSIDPYAAFRSAYLQYRTKKIRQGLK